MTLWRHLCLINRLVNPVVLVSELELSRVELFLLRDHFDLLIVIRCASICRNHSLLEVRMVEIGT